MIISPNKIASLAISPPNFQNLIKKFPTGTINLFSGLKIIVDPFMPENIILLVDKHLRPVGLIQNVGDDEEQERRSLVLSYQGIWLWR